VVDAIDVARARGQANVDSSSTQKLKEEEHDCYIIYGKFVKDVNSIVGRRGACKKRKR
jgi:hypothetical protein